MSPTHLEILRLRLENFHTIACFHTLVWEKSYTSMGKNHIQVWKISHTSMENFPLHIWVPIKYGKFPKIFFRVKLCMFRLFSVK